MNNHSNHPRAYDVVLGGQSLPAILSAILQELREIKQKRSWRLIYAHDEYGKPTAGNVNLLIDAIRNGHKVRIVIDIKDYEYALDADILWIRNGVVYAQNTSAVSAAFKGERLVFLEDSYYFMTIVNTKGDREVIRWSVGEHRRKDGLAHNKVAAKWFVD
ncbi:MAG: hypothetical protein N3E45_00730 [Oscillatoriaceae bacterium SKW80]|nr:hypothetical protein [Oscillatoriaceae bacterium SKYG93]MCX8119354.1 hypothetical protein [Oscillatoriaceae bacterium SKW80]MDW8454821.1 hypothetical protein [Oscillatoriaceae cyanobacterium SKYGB_i_bin93]HIK28399.1 hypothetical protein [Oscillatoriaceae cyanobacterium M7585_C2015_266]